MMVVMNANINVITHVYHVKMEHVLIVMMAGIFLVIINANRFVAME